MRRQIDEILERSHVVRYIEVSLKTVYQHSFKQERPGRPGPDTRYMRRTQKRWKIEWRVKEDKVAFDQKSDGAYPPPHERPLAHPEAGLEAHKRRPAIEKIFSQVKTVLEIAPVLLKNEGRVEALFFLYFSSLLVQALIEREMRNAMEREGITDIPL